MATRDAIPGSPTGDVRLQGLERGLAVIQAFGHDTPSMTLSVRACGRPRDRRATATALLLTVPTQDSTNAVMC